MKRVFAILAEPASYTLDRNKAIYDPMGIEYAYIKYKSMAKSQTNLQINAYCNFSFCRLYNEMKRIVTEYEVIIMNGYTGRTFWALFLANFFIRKPVGIESDTQLQIPHNPLKRIIKHIVLRFLFTRKWMYGLAGGNFVHKDLFRYYGMSEDRIFLMPMVVDNRRFYFMKNRPCEPFIFLYVGRLVDFKHTPLMVQAFIKDFAYNDKVQLRVVGEGPYMKELMLLSQGHDNIQLVGAKFGQDLVLEYQNAHVFILPSTYEQWGLVVNEALSASMPVIVSDTVGSSYDLVKERNTGLIFKDGDINSLASCMKKITNNSELYNKMTQNAYGMMLNHWNYDFYKECLYTFINHVK